MPIKGISDVRRMPRVGKVRLGIKDVSLNTHNEYPKAVDYFVVNADQSTQEQAAQNFHAVYGDQPRALDIMFPTDDPAQFFQQWYRRYGSGTGLICKGDGEVAQEVDRETGEMRDIECPGPECEWAQKDNCKSVGTLQFLLPKVAPVGVWQLDTSSWNSIVNLNSAIDLLAKLRGGRVGMIPVTLIVKPKDVQVEGKKKTVYVLDLILPNVTLEALMDMKAGEPKGLPEPVNLNEPPDDLYPQSVIRGPVDEQVEYHTEPQATEAENIRKAIRKNIEDLQSRWKAANNPATADQMDYLRTLLCKAEPQDAKRHSATMYLIGKASTKEFTQAEASALIGWFKDTKNGGLKESGAAEIAACVSARMVEAGQQPLGL